MSVFLFCVKFTVAIMAAKIVLGPSLTGAIGLKRIGFYSY